jgi:uncharacterized protein with NAD-binding domain and iron-sulfur cluster
VAVFGGGIAGLTATHELAERGFDVTIYERRAWGGKARSTEVRGTATGGRRPLPGEHAYRVPFGCYQNLPDTMRRIPFGSNPNGTFDNLVAMRQILLARVDKRDLLLPLASLDPRPHTPQQIVDLLVGLLIEMQLPPQAAVHLANRLAVFFSSCDARRFGEWEKTSWTDFVGGNGYGEDFRATLAALPQFTQASRADQSSAKYVAWLFESWWIYPLLGFGTNGPPWRVLDRPTNEVLIDPWLAELRRLGARLRLHHELTGLDMRHGRIAGAHVRTPHGRRTVVADWYVTALPVERARKLWNPKILAADPRLEQMNRLGTAWMNGIMLYLRERPRILEGIVACADSPWAMTFIPQAQFWPLDFARTYGDGTVKEKLSVAIADWTRPGIVVGKPARDCTPEEIALEVWEEIKRHVNNSSGSPTLTDAMLHSWNIDPGLIRRHGRWISEDALVLPTIGTEQYRPDVKTAIPNLMLCGDYCNGDWQVANMEAANFNGRRAANAVLERAASHETPARTVESYSPPEWEPLKQLDDQRYAHGQPNVFDLPTIPQQLASLLNQ